MTTRSLGSERVAVLPFENLGDSSDAYFADGVSDEIRGKMSQTRGTRHHRSRQLQRVSAHAKAPQEIAPGWGPSTC